MGVFHEKWDDDDDDDDDFLIIKAAGSLFSL